MKSENRYQKVLEEENGIASIFSKKTSIPATADEEEIILAWYREFVLSENRSYEGFYYEPQGNKSGGGVVRNGLYEYSGNYLPHGVVRNGIYHK